MVGVRSTEDHKANRWVCRVNQVVLSIVSRCVIAGAGQGNACRLLTDNLHREVRVSVAIRTFICHGFVCTNLPLARFQSSGQSRCRRFRHHFRQKAENLKGKNSFGTEISYTFSARWGHCRNGSIGKNWKGIDFANHNKQQIQSINVLKYPRLCIAWFCRCRGVGWTKADSLVIRVFKKKANGWKFANRCPWAHEVWWRKIMVRFPKYKQKESTPYHWLPSSTRSCLVVQ